MGEQKHCLADGYPSHGTDEICLGWIEGRFDVQSEQRGYCGYAGRATVSSLLRRSIEIYLKTGKMGRNGRHLQRHGKVLKGTTRQHPHGNCVQFQNSGPKPLFGPLAPVRMLGLPPTASYQTTQDALKPVAHGLYVQIVHVGPSIATHVHLGSKRLAPCIE